MVSIGAPGGNALQILRDKTLYGILLSLKKERKPKKKKRKKERKKILSFVTT